MNWGWHQPFVTGEKGCFITEGFLQCPPPHLWASLKPHCPVCFSTVFILCFPNKQDFSYQNDPTATLYRIPHLRSAEHQLILGGRGVRPCLKSPPTPCKQWGEPGSRPSSASVTGTEQTQPSAEGQGKVLVKSLPGHIYSFIRMRIHGPCPPL